MNMSRKITPISSKGIEIDAILDEHLFYRFKSYIVSCNMLFLLELQLYHESQIRSKY